MSDNLRLDHYLHRARIFKSRSKATDACREGRVLVNDKTGKAASDVAQGDLVKIREKGLYRTIRVLELPGKNLSKEDAKTTWADETPEDVLMQREQIAIASRINRNAEKGPRPTKKDRRELAKKRGW